ncbi:equilibrative nucleoside transporter 2 [Triplophysa rosa]|uniref:Equilibrative nucleoside transporter 2 n=1 Tax=Triplophysa rosa TaxID=992332 RepID=A0A9W7TH31_TRIRA|nr:equilibrative nucleoside transporter 2 [Triplophysa rosa]KAI7796311.1 equilibrative nucleoside transporter 2 [Triplophysa rosa]
MRHCKGASTNSGLVAAIFFLLGMGTLLPWNFFITAMNYFTGRLNGTSCTNGTEQADSDPYMFNNLSVLIAQLPLLLFTFLNSFLYQHIAEKVRIAGSMVFILLLFILTASLVKVEMTLDHFFSITMATIWFINMFGAVLQGSLFGLVSKLPPRYNSLFMSGQAVAGIFSGIAMLLSNILETDSESSALGYFITPCVATLITLCCYLILPHLSFARLYLESGPTDKAETRKEPLTNNCESVTLVNVKLNDESGLEANGKAVFTESDSESCNKLDEHKQEPTEEKSTVPQVFEKIWVMASCVTCVFAVTLSVFPAITVNTKPKGFFEGKDKIFVPLCSFIVFNVMDWIGRSLTSRIQWPSKQSWLFPLFVLLRVVFIPALMLCNVQPRIYLPVLFDHDMAYLVFMSLFAMTSGYFACLSMSYASQLVKPKDAETAGALMTFFLALGLSLGAAFSFVLKKMV